MSDIPDGMILYLSPDGKAWLADEDRTMTLPLGKLKKIKIGDGCDHEVFETVKDWGATK